MSLRLQGFDSFEPGNFELNLSCASIGISDLENFNFNYFPNPVNNVLTTNGNENITNISVYNVLEQEVIKTVPN